MNIVAFAGKKQSGKTSSCVFVKHAFLATHHNGISGTDTAECTIYNFADPLKQMCIDILGFTHQQCYGTDDNKNEKVNCFWPDSKNQMTSREVLQYIGTDIFRAIQTNVWADATIRKIQKNKNQLSLIADCRFPNEVDAIKNAGGIVIKLNRDLYQSSHISENALEDNVYDQSNFDLIIDNSSMTENAKNNLILNYLKDKGILSL